MSIYVLYIMIQVLLLHGVVVYCHTQLVGT